MTCWCVDANVVIATLLKEASSEAAQQFWSNLVLGDEVIAPLVLFPECTSALRRKVVSGELSESEGYQVIEEMLALPIRVEDSRGQFRLAFDWATRMKRTKTHDLQYLAVAQIFSATVVSLDGGMEQAAVERSIPLMVLR